MLQTCLSEDAAEGSGSSGNNNNKTKPCTKSHHHKMALEIPSSKKRIKRPQRPTQKFNDGLLKEVELEDGEGIDISSDAIRLNQTSLTQSSSDSSYSSYEEEGDDDDDYSCASNTSSEDSDISLCRSRKFGNELDLNRPNNNNNEALMLSSSSGPTSMGASAVEITIDSGECMTTTLADFLFDNAADGACNMHFDEEEPENNVATRLQKLKLSKRAPQQVAASSPIRKKSSLKRVATILEKSSLNRPPKHNVGFRNVNVREYRVSISHNPSVSEGPPVELGWSFEEATPIPVDLYEESRGPKRRLAEFVLSENTRRRMLLEKGGYSRQDLKEAIREVEHLKRQRILTYMMLPASAFDEAAEEMFSALTSAFK